MFKFKSLEVNVFFLFSKLKVIIENASQSGRTVRGKSFVRLLSPFNLFI